LKANDSLNAAGNLSPLTVAIAHSLKASSINYPKWSIAAELFLPADRKTIRVMHGREFDWFDEDSQREFFQQSFILGHNSDQMGYQLKGRQLTRVVTEELLSTAVTPGTTQVTNNGDPVLLMASCQTTGGYPRIAQVAAVDLPLCAQLKAGDAITFKEISWKEAEKLYIQLQLDLCKLTGAIRSHYHFE
jgi:antagonist of KipI